MRNSDVKLIYASVYINCKIPKEQRPNFLSFYSALLNMGPQMTDELSQQFGIGQENRGLA